MRPLWKTKRPLLGLCSLLEEQAPSSSSPPGTAERVVFPPQTHMKCPFCQAPNPYLTPSLLLLPRMPPWIPRSWSRQQSSPPSLGGLCSPWWDCSAVCERAATQPHGPRRVCQQEITKPPLTTSGDRLTLLPHHGMGYGVPHTLDAAQIFQPAETSPLPMSQGAGPICIRQGNPDMSRLWGHQSRG